MQIAPLQLQDNLDVWTLLLELVRNPSPLFGATLGSLLTAGFFGWISHGRSIRPVLVFTRDADEVAPRWQLQNVGAGAALNIRIRDYDAKGQLVKGVHAYPLSPGPPRSIRWVLAGIQLEADYTDAYGRRMYISIGKDNATVYKRRLRKIWLKRPGPNHLKGYLPEIHELRQYDRDHPAS